MDLPVNAKFAGTGRVVTPSVGWQIVMGYYGLSDAGVPRNVIATQGTAGMYTLRDRLSQALARIFPPASQGRIRMISKGTDFLTIALHHTRKRMHMAQNNAPACDRRGLR